MDGVEPPKILRRDALGRVRVPRERREELVDEFERSGLPATRFAQAAGINHPTFAWWVQQRRHARGDYNRKPRTASAAIRFVEAVTPPCPEPRPLAAQDVLELTLPGGVILRVCTPKQAALAAQLLNALRTSC